MKKIKEILLLLFGFLLLPFWGASQAHLVNKSGHVVSGDAFLVLKNSSLTNNGTINHSAGTVKMMGNTTDANSAIGGTTAPIFNNLTISKTANNVPLAQDITVNGTLTMEGGHLDLQDKNLIASTITGAMTSHYIKTSSTGQLKQQVSNSEVDFPIGNSSFNPIKMTNSGTEDLIGVRIEDQVLENLTSGDAIADASVNRVWHTSEAVAGGSNLAVNVQWNGAEELSNFDRSQSTFASFENGAWTAKNSGAATVGSTGDATFIGTGITTLGGFTISTIICETNSDALLSIPPPVAGGDQLAICGMEVMLDATTPNGSMGQWSISSTNGVAPTFDAAMNITSSLTGVFGGMYTLRWTVADGACATIFDEVQVSFVADEDIPGGDGVQDCVDVCLGGDDRIDSDNSGLPDACDCSPTDVTNDFVALNSADVATLIAALPTKETLLRRADYEMTSTASIEAKMENVYPDVNFQSGSSITLMPGFHAKAGSVFSAFIEDCLEAPVTLTNEEATLLSQKQQTEQTDFLAQTPQGVLELKILPNIVKEQAAVKIAIPKNQHISLHLYNQQGKRLRTFIQKEQRLEGTHYYKLDASQLPGGFYFLQLQGDTELVTQKFVVAR